MQNNPDQTDRDPARAATGGDGLFDERESSVREREQAARARESAVDTRESAADTRESAVDARESVVARREDLARFRDEALRARAEAEEARADRERLLLQMREANEKLVIAALRWDELLEEATAAREEAEDLAARLGESEQALRASEELFRVLANNIPMLAWYADPDGQIPWHNQRWYDYTGTTPEEHAGWESVHDPEDLPRVLAKWRAALASGEPWEDVSRLRRYDGELRWFLSRAFPLRDPSGRIVRWFGTNVDIDDQKRAEAQAKAANRAKDEFLAMLGHELRNPIAPIMTALELVQLRDPTAFPRERTIIARQVTHLVRLVDDLLDISRITGGKIKLHREPIELATVVSRAVETASPVLEKKLHNLVVNVAAQGLAVNGDAARLVQVVSNLLTNAAKFTPPKGTITITGERRGATVSLRVRDTGIGISRAMLPHVFEMFAQERQAADRSQGGLGLGLAIAQSLVAMHGGTVTAHSEGAGRGSELVIELPALAGAREAPRTVAAADRAVAQATRPAPHKILVVDDNRDAAELLMESLVALGHDVRVAFDGPSALAVVEGFTPDVALLDIGLPVMDGYELADRIHAMAEGTKLIAITGYGQPTDRTRSMEAGFSMHLVKPVDLATVQDGIQQVMTDAAPSTSR
jgi:PAS domain S-box-containing protein